MPSREIRQGNVEARIGFDHGGDLVRLLLFFAQPVEPFIQRSQRLRLIFELPEGHDLGRFELIQGKGERRIFDPELFADKQFARDEFRWREDEDARPRLSLRGLEPWQATALRRPTSATRGPAYK